MFASGGQLNNIKLGGKYMKKVLSIILVGIMAMNLIACAGGSGKAATTTNESGEKVIKIGVFEPQTGENGGGGIQEVYGIRYANSIYNTVNIGGEDYKIELLEVDNKSDKTEAVNAAQKLIAEKVVAVLGSYGSGVSIAAGEYFKEGKTPAIGCSCTNPQVTNGNDYYFRTCFLDPFQGTVMASYAEKHGYNKVAVITQLGDDYSEGLGNFFVRACNEKGMEVVAQEKFQTNEQDFRAILTNIKNADPEFIFAPSSIATAPLILSQARELGITCQIGAGDTWENGTIIENAHGAAEGMVVTTFYEANPSTASGEEAIFLNGNGEGVTAKGFSNYLVNVEKQSPDIPAVSALGYDAYLAAYKAIEKAQSIEGPAVRDALASLQYEGVTGEISFNDDGDANKDSAYVKEVENGKFVFKEKVGAN